MRLSQPKALGDIENKGDAGSYIQYSIEIGFFQKLVGYRIKISSQTNNLTKMKRTSSHIVLDVMLL